MNMRNVLSPVLVALAEFFSLDDEMGTIDVGKKADLVLLDANPLDNMANTKRIAAAHAAESRLQ
jgi:imidazolonepropionase-like amidohydrolase